MLRCVSSFSLDASTVFPCSRFVLLFFLRLEMFLTKWVRVHVMNHWIERAFFDFINRWRLLGWFVGCGWFSVDVKLHLPFLVHYFDVKERKTVVYFRLHWESNFFLWILFRRSKTELVSCLLITAKTSPYPGGITPSFFHFRFNLFFMKNRGESSLPIAGCLVEFAPEGEIGFSHIQGCQFYVLANFFCSFRWTFSFVAEVTNIVSITVCVRP